MAENLKFTDINVTLNPYYTGDDVWLRFTVGDSDGAITPSAANLSLLKPDNSEVGPVAATISDNEVSYKIGGTHTTLEGAYRAYFVLILPTYGERTHKIEFEVNRNPERWPK